MARAIVIATAAVVIAGLTGCAAAHTHNANRRVAALGPGLRGTPDKSDVAAREREWAPEAAAILPKYPKFSQHSCWAQPFGDDPVYRDRFAPSYAPAPRAHPIPPATVVRRLLARLGDRRYVRAVRLRRAPYRNYGGTPPSDSLTATIVMPYRRVGDHPTPQESLTAGIARYERAIVAGALRDDFCDAGGAPLLLDYEPWIPLGQRFPNPSPAEFRKRVALAGRRFGFTVVSLRLLHPRQIAPLLIVKTHRSRAAFVDDVARIMRLLDPANWRSAAAFEAFFFAAEDEKGPFVWRLSALRGAQDDGRWAANPCLLTYGPSGGPVPPCR